MDEIRDLKFPPNLKLSDVETGHFQRIKVSSAMHVFSNLVAMSFNKLRADTYIENMHFFCENRFHH